MKPKHESLTLLFNRIMTNVVILAGIVVVYLPDIIQDSRNLALAMLALTLVTTFGNRWIRINKTTTGIGK